MKVSQIQPAYDLLELPGDALYEPLPGMTLGPFIGELQNHASRLAVVRGMSMETLSHATGRRRFLTGKAPSGSLARGSSSDVWLSSHLGADAPVPNLAMQMESYNRGLPNFASALRTAQHADLIQVLRAAEPSFGSLHDQQIAHLLENFSMCPEAAPSQFWHEAAQAVTKKNEMVQQNLAGYFDYQEKYADNPQMAWIREHYDIPDSGSLETPEVMAAVAATSIMEGISRCASISDSPALDTHFSDWIEDQGENQMRGFNAVARMASHLEMTQYKDTSESWLDHTVIVGFSEFSRSPLLNVNQGRDHWLLNACFAMGGGIKGGQVLGASSDYGMNPQAINLETGALDPQGEVPRPEHIIAALYEEVGIGDEPDLRVDPLRAILDS